MLKSRSNLEERTNKLSNEVKFYCSRKQQEPLIPFKLTLDRHPRLRARRANHSMTQTFHCWISFNWDTRHFYFQDCRIKYAP